MFWAFVWYYLLALFSIADIITTRVLLNLGFVEGNPLMAPFLNYMVEMKVIVMGLALITIIIYENLKKGEGWVPVALGTTFTFCIVIQNILRGFLFAIS